MTDAGQLTLPASWAEVIVMTIDIIGYDFQDILSLFALCVELPSAIDDLTVKAFMEDAMAAPP